MKFTPGKTLFLVITTGITFSLLACEPTEASENPTPSSKEQSSETEKSQSSPDSSDDSSADSKTEKPSKSTDSETEKPDPSEEDESTTGDETPTEDESSSSTGDFKNVGKCGILGEAIVTDDSYEGKVEYYMIADKGDGEDLCLVRFDARSVGTPDVECPRCEWTYMVEFSNPEVVTNTDNLCANSERQLDEEAIAALDGSRRGYGHIPEFGGHEEFLMELNSMGEWEGVARSEWTPDTGEFTFNNSHGFCKY